MFGIPPFTAYLRRTLNNRLNNDQISACFKMIGDDPKNYPLTADIGVADRLRTLLSRAVQKFKMVELLNHLQTEYGIIVDLSDYPEYHYRWLYNFIFYHMSRDEIVYVLQNHYPVAYGQISWENGIEYVIEQLMIFCQHYDRLPELARIVSEFNMPYFIENCRAFARRDLSVTI